LKKIIQLFKENVYTAADETKKIKNEDTSPKEAIDESNFESEKK
jgi:hypothetical protein